MLVGLLAHALDGLALLGQACFLADLVVVAVEIVDIGRDNNALGVLPGAGPDAVAGVDGSARIGGIGVAAEVGLPSLAARPRRLRQRLAVPIRAFEAAEIGALARPGAGDEEAHVGLLRQG